MVQVTFIKNVSTETHKKNWAKQHSGANLQSRAKIFETLCSPPPLLPENNVVATIPDNIVC